jgi:hypothetical protein
MGKLRGATDRLIYHAHITSIGAALIDKKPHQPFKKDMP